MNKLVWHYTTREKLPKIMFSGELRPAATALELPEKPILWFSNNQYWENSASKGFTENGVIQKLSMEETKLKGKGLVRFGIKPDRLHRWPKLWKKARMTAAQAKQLEIVAANQDAKPSDWYGATKPIPVDRIKAIHVMSETGEWEEVSK